MKLAGIIAEYNPFHNGHAHHIAETRRRTDCDYVIICMAGNYTQRGEAACMDKWTRARIALSCGADAVFELPALWAVNTADSFARGGVGILAGIGCDLLSFGCEAADEALLNTLADLRENEPPALAEGIRSKLGEGKSHARARGEALAEYLNLDADTLNMPNLMLGVEYVRAIRSLGSKMEICAVPRIGGYHDDALGRIASASAIRSALRRGEDVRFAMPECSYDAFLHLETMHAPDDLLLHTLRRMTEAEIAALPGVSEGLEKRIRRMAAEAYDYESLIGTLKCKRYTHARIARICAYALLGVDQKMMQDHAQPEYARLIGMRTDAQPLLKELKRRSALPIVSDAAKLSADPLFQLECRVTDLRALQCELPESRCAGQEFRRKFVRV